ncbi:MAG: peptidyl-prolyl cis-trans isomerase [Acidobacteriota bacterium]
MTMNRFLTALSFAATLIGAVAPAPASAEEPVNHIVLRVNDEILTLFDYENRKEAEIRNLLADSRIQPAERQERLGSIGKDVMQQMFREMLVESFSRQNGISVSEREIDDAVQQVQERQGISTTEGLLTALEQAGLSLDALRTNLRQELLLSNVVRREVTSQIEVTDDELRAYYRNNPAQFQVDEQRRLEEVIVLDSSGLGTEEQLAKAQEIRQRLVDGDSFEEVTATYQDEGISTGVIDLGWLGEGDLGESLSEAAFAAPLGGYTPPVQARGGYHIVYVAEVKEGFVRPFEEVQDLIMSRERQRRFGTELQKFMARIEETSFIEENLPADAVGYRAVGAPALDVEEDELRGLTAPLLPEAEALEEETQEAIDEDREEGAL